MKLLRRGLALFLSIALVFSLVAVMASSNWVGRTSLGMLSRYYETGSLSDEDAAGVISTVDGDPGGKSYGAYMFASKTGTVKAFIQWCLSDNPSNSAAYAIGEKLHTAYYSGGEGCGPLFDQAWKELATNDKSAFFSAQEAFVKSDLYDEAIKLICATYPAFNINNYSVALKNVIWSRAVHHGPSGAASVVIRAFNAMGGFFNQPEGDLIVAIYRESGRVVDAATLAAETNGGTAKGLMGDTMAAKYGVDGKILRYWYGSSGPVQVSVYRRLNVNEPADALSMLQTNAYVNAPLSEGSYTVSLKKDASTLVLGLAEGAAKVVNTAGDDAATAAKFTLNYLSGVGAYTISTTVTNADNTVSTLRLDATTAGSDGFGAVNLSKPTASDTQLWYIDSDGGVKNKATGTYLSCKNDKLVVVGNDGAPMTVTVKAAASDNDLTETFTQVLPEGSTDTPQTLAVTFVVGDNGTIAEGSTASFETGTSSDFTVAQLHKVTPKEGWTFDGWFTEGGMQVTAGAMGAAGTLTLYAHYTSTSTVAPAVWTFSPVVEDMSDFALRQVVYPNEESELHVNDSGFPVRGIISCSGTISSVTLAVKTSKGAVVSYANCTATPKATYYDLSRMDSSISYSKLTEGDYTYTLSATVDGKTFTFIESDFTVDKALTTGGSSSSGSDEYFTVTFDAGENGTCAVVSKSYSLDSVIYGSLPSVTPNSGWGFAGWYTEYGEQILPGTRVLAADITLHARYTKIYPYTFLNATGGTYHSGSTAAGTLFDAPAEAPVKVPDSQYTYTFSHWVDKNNVTYSSGETIVMVEEGMTFTPVYVQTTKPSGGTTTPGDSGSGGTSGGGSGSGGGGGTAAPSGTYWVLTPGTSVSQIGSPVYKGNNVVSSGSLATGMTTTIDGIPYTFSIKGDFDGNGRVTINDVVKLQSHLLNKSPLTGAALAAADLNKDLKVSITDLVKCARVVAGKDTIS